MATVFYSFSLIFFGTAFVSYWIDKDHTYSTSRVMTGIGIGLILAAIFLKL